MKELEVTKGNETYYILYTRSGINGSIRIEGFQIYDPAVTKDWVTIKEMSGRVYDKLHEQVSEHYIQGKKDYGFDE